MQTKLIEAVVTISGEYQTQDSKWAKVVFNNGIAKITKVYSLDEEQGEQKK